MKVALYEEGEFWKSPTITRIFESLEIAKQAIPKEFKDKTEEYGFYDVYAEDKCRSRYITIKILEIEKG